MKREELIGTKEAAEIIGVSTQRVRAMVASGLLSARKVGGVLLYDAAEVRAFERRPPGRPSTRRSE